MELWLFLFEFELDCLLVFDADGFVEVVVAGFEFFDECDGLLISRGELFFHCII